MLEGEIDENVNWWKDVDLIKEMDSEYEDWKAGKAKGYTTKEIEADIKKLQAKRSKKWIMNLFGLRAQKDNFLKRGSGMRKGRRDWVNDFGMPF